MSNKQQSNQYLDMSIIILILLALLYISGWSYAYHYFAKYNAGLLDFNISKEYFFIYAFWVIRSEWLLISIFFCFLYLSFLLITFVNKMSSQIRGELIQNSCKISIIFFIFLLHLVSFIFFYQIAKRAANSDFYYQSISDFPSYPLVKIWIKQDMNIINPLIHEELKKGCFRLLLKNNGKTYLFNNEKNYLDKHATFIIPDNNIELIQILPCFVSCPNR